MAFSSNRLKLIADYFSWPLWDVDAIDTVDPQNLPHSKSLIRDLSEWQIRFDAILDTNDPTSSGFETQADEDDFCDAGWDLLDRLKTEMPNIEFTYHDKRYKKTLSSRPISPP